MLAAFVSTLLLAISAICGYRTTAKLGGVEANFWRLALATIFLTIWATTFGSGFNGAPEWFLLSGFFGIGLGDTAYFQTLPRLHTRRTVLITQCLLAPFAALIEWLWLGTKLNYAEIFCIAVILGGVAIALAPDDQLKISARAWKSGLLFGTLAALGSAIGAVLSRKAYAVAHAAGLHPDPGTTSFQRLLGGIIVPTILLLALKTPAARAHGGLLELKTFHVSREKWRRVWPWVLANALAGQTLGMTCVQWAYETTPAAIVAAIIALTPLILLPMTLFLDGEKIGARSIIGVAIAVGGVIGLALCH
jgi:drug/metabolite transporter (DMT)-like permease